LVHRRRPQSCALRGLRIEPSDQHLEGGLRSRPENIAKTTEESRCGQRLRVQSQPRSLLVDGASYCCIEDALFGEADEFRRFLLKCTSIGSRRETDDSLRLGPIEKDYASETLNPSFAKPSVLYCPKVSHWNALVRAEDENGACSTGQGLGCLEPPLAVESAHVFESPPSDTHFGTAAECLFEFGGQARGIELSRVRIPPDVRGGEKSCKLRSRVKVTV
jgi:hypothetical protein